MLAPATVVSYVAHGHARINRIIASAWPNSVIRVFSSPLFAVNNNQRGTTCDTRSDEKTPAGSNTFLNPAVATSRIAKKLLKPRASTSLPFKLNSTSSSERYAHPAVANWNVSVDLPLPEGPITRTPAPLTGSTTPAPCNSNNPKRLSAAQTANEVIRA